MRMDKLAVTAQEALQAAVGIAADADASQTEPIHLLKALLDSGDHNLQSIVERVGANPRHLLSEVDDAIAREPKVTGQGLSQMGMARNLIKVIEDAEKLAELLR